MPDGDGEAVNGNSDNGDIVADDAIVFLSQSCVDAPARDNYERFINYPGSDPETDINFLKTEVSGVTAEPVARDTKNFTEARACT